MSLCGRLVCWAGLGWVGGRERGGASVAPGARCHSVIQAVPISWHPSLKSSLLLRGAPHRPVPAGLLQSLLGGGSGGSGSGGAPNLGPLISAVLGDKEAASALPDVLGLLGKLGIGLPGTQQQA